MASISNSQIFSSQDQDFSTASQAAIVPGLSSSKNIDGIAQRSLGSSVDGALADALQASVAALARFGQREDFAAGMELAFGAEHDVLLAQQWFSALADDSTLPRVEVLEGDDLNGAPGVYAQANDTVYLSRQFVESASVDQLTGVLLEEFGHGIDARVNSADAAGDEGDIFARLVLGQEIGAKALQALRAEDDSGQVVVNGRGLAVEQAQQDFDGDGEADMFWRNEETGQNKIAFSYGTGQQREEDTDDLRPQWVISGTGDFDGDGKTDVLWRDSETGENTIWFMNGATRQREELLLKIGDTNWMVAGTNDFDGDNKTDIVWRNDKTGQNLIWQMNGSVPRKTEVLKSVTGRGWKVSATDDFNNDNKPDILWRHQESDRNVAWLMDGSQETGTLELAPLGNSNLRIHGTGDINGDGHTDLLLRDNVAGKNIARLMNRAEKLEDQEFSDRTHISWRPSAYGFNASEQNFLEDHIHEDDEHGHEEGELEGIVPESGNPIIESLRGGPKWDSNEITYSFLSSASASTYQHKENASELTQPIKDLIRYAIKNAIEPLINITFREVSDTPSSFGDIRYLFTPDIRGGEGYAAARYPGGGSGGDVFFHPRYTLNQLGLLEKHNAFDAGLGSHGYESIIHETLHALGLKHPGDYNGDGKGQSPFLDKNIDNNTNTVMSYHWPGSSAVTPMAYDIKALQYIYGVGESNSSSDTYRFTSVHQFSVNNQEINKTDSIVKQSIFDSAGSDTLDFSSLSDTEHYYIDIRPGGVLTKNSAFNASFYTHRANKETPDEHKKYWSHSYGTTISDNTTLENVVNSPGSDQIFANSASNRFSGYRRDGRTGQDTYWYTNSADTLDLSSYSSSDVNRSRRGNDEFISLGNSGSITIKDYYASSSKMKILLAEPVGKPDLIVENISVPSTIVVGDSVNISAYTKNVGNATADASTLKYWLSNDTTLSSNDIELGSDAVESLAVNGVEGDSHSFTYDSAWGTGTKYILFEADALDAVEEISESNNMIARAINVQPKPYITVTSPNGGDRITSGNTLPISWTDNISGTVKIDLFRGNQFSRNIISSTASDGSYDWNVPIDITSGSDYEIRISSASDPSIYDESDRFFSILPQVYSGDFSMNMSASATRVDTDGSGRKWNEAIERRENYALPGDEFEMRIYVTNNSQNVARDLKFGVYLSRDIELDSTDARISTPKLEYFPSNYTWIIDIDNLTLPDSSHSVWNGNDSYFLIVKADEENEFIETDESNNLSFKKVNVGRDWYINASKPDLKSTNLVVPSVVEVGSEVTVSVDIQNDALVNASPSTVKYWLSDDTSISNDDISLGENSVSVLTPTTSSKETLTFTYDPSWGLGRKYLLFESDSKNMVDENDEGNNVSFASINVIYSSSDLKKYRFYYNFNPDNYLAADSYAGWVIAPKGTYQVAPQLSNSGYDSAYFFNPNSQITEAGLDGKYVLYLEEDYDDSLTSEIGRVFVHTYFDRDNDSVREFTPYKYSQGVQPAGLNFLGSESDHLVASRTNFYLFGQDYYEADTTGAEGISFISG